MSAGLLKRDLIGMGLDRAAVRKRWGVGGVGEIVKDVNLRHKQVYALAGGLSSMIFFKESVGNNNKTLQDTNMEENGKLPESKDFLVEGIELKPFSLHATEATRLADLVELLNTGVVILKYKDAPRFEHGKLIDFVADKSLIGIDATSGETGRQYFMLRNPILLEGGKNFELIVQWPGGSPAITANVELEFLLLGQELSTAASA